MMQKKAYYSDSIDFDPESNTFWLYSNGSNDIFIFKLDSSGNFVWAKSIGGKGDSLHELSEGIYFLQVYDQDGRLIKVEKIVKRP